MKILKAGTRIKIKPLSQLINKIFWNSNMKYMAENYATIIEYDIDCQGYYIKPDKEIKNKEYFTFPSRQKDWIWHETMFDVKENIDSNNNLLLNF